ncbi:vacuolar protein 8-like isoform X2 [Diospyros lotus]|uniref:vacuolar protein 8-like isoform X2 n=1 Tax=Diospyros lotus TaxID=55363 RepID=UPI00225C35A6|nr:vacuolar protein 8-like isoform X2 [Diospyros lotus]
MKFNMGEEKSQGESNHDQNALPESSAWKPSIRLAIELITFLISQSHSIRVLSVKWQSIRTRLEDLLSGLAAVQNSNSGENPPLAAAVSAMIDTIKDCHGLAQRCIDRSFCGKLRMQSDLDIICSKLDSHAKNLAEIYTAGLLRESYAIVVSRPGLSASRDDMKFYVKDLFSRLKIGGKELKKQAFFALNEVFYEDEKYVKIAMEIAGLVGVLVNFLDCQEIDLQEEAAKAISTIAGFDSCKSALVLAGVIPPLIGVLEGGSETGRENSTRCLMKLTQNSDNAWSVSAHGGVTALMKICSNCESSTEVVGLACGVLRNLVGVEEIKKFMIEEGAIAAFIKLLRSKDEVLFINSAEILQTIAIGDGTIGQTIYTEGGIALLVQVLDPKSSFSLKSREMALKSIVNLSFSSINILRSYGFLDHILFFLRHGEASAQELALKAASWLCGTSEEAKKDMAEAGFMRELVKFLDAKSLEAQEMAAETLYGMVSVPKNRKLFMQDEENVSLILQMLGEEEGNSGRRRLLLSILVSLTSCHSARKKMAHSGYLKNVAKLAEAEVSDAKKIVRKVSSNRFSRMLSGFWHF